MFFLVFFFKQKTAYEMRISDWSSDVCSSDLEGGDTAGLLSEIDSLESYQESFDRCEDFGIFVNDSTLETELLDCGFGTELFATLRDGGLSSERKARVAEWEEDESQVDREELVREIEEMGQGGLRQGTGGTA